MYLYVVVVIGHRYTRSDIPVVVGTYNRQILRRHCIMYVQCTVLYWTVPGSGKHTYYTHTHTSVHSSVCVGGWSGWVGGSGPGATVLRLFLVSSLTAVSVCASLYVLRLRLLRTPQPSTSSRPRLFRHRYHERFPPSPTMLPPQRL